MDAFDVVVIGAGLSGLKAANDIMTYSRKFGERPLTVLVVEAQSHVGGRVKSAAHFTSPDERGVCVPG